MQPIPRLAACVLACLLPSATFAVDRPGYGDATEYFQTDAQYEAWFDLTRALRRDFDWICGDTFCEGEYSNIQSLRYRSEEHTSELQSRENLVCRLLLEKKK